MESKNCPICNEEIFSRAGWGCKLCGMPLIDGEEFCSDGCKLKYEDIHFTG